MSKIILDVSTDGTVISYDETSEGKIELKYNAPDVQSVQDYCAEQRAISKGAHERKGDLHRIMSVPLAVFTEIRARTGKDFLRPEDWEGSNGIAAILRGREYAQFRTTDARI
jgi:hypothetical protein